MRGDKFSAKRSRAYRRSPKEAAAASFGVSDDLHAAVLRFRDVAGLASEEEAVLLLVTAGLGLAAQGADRFCDAIAVFGK
jgi:hypothetical protein